MDKKDSYVQLDFHYQTIKGNRSKANKSQNKKEVTKELASSIPTQ
jgi:hypothetical protein